MKKFVLCLANVILCHQSLFAISITNVTTNGNGCPPESVETHISGDGESLTLTYNRFLAEIDQTRRKSRSQCFASMTLDIPQGKTLGIFSIDHRGYASLDEKTKATINSEVKGKRRWKRVLKEKLAGPTDEDFRVNGKFAFKTGRFKNCIGGKPVTIDLKTTIKVKGKNDNLGFITVDSSDKSLIQTLNLTALDCHAKYYATSCQIKVRKRGQQGRTIQILSSYAKSKDKKISKKRAKAKAKNKCRRLKKKFAARIEHCAVRCARPVQF